MAAAAPLPLESLGAKRFGDLVRQLAYGFRTWKSLEPEMDPADLAAVEVIGDGIESTTLERSWRIRARAQKSVTPKAIRQLVRDTVPDPARAPHGLVVATTANVSRVSIEAFHDEAAKVRLREAHLWSRPRIEELLLRPENDAVLFAYFGLSLRLRRRSRLEELRHLVSIKERLVAAFGEPGLPKDIGHHDVVLRSTYDQAFPAPPPETGTRRSWQFARTFSLLHDRLGVELEDWIGVRRADGTWDIDEATAFARENPRGLVNDDPAGERRSRERALLERASPETERVRVIGVGWIPLDRIVLLDRVGTPGDPAAHVFCDFGSENGPFTSFSRIAYSGGWPMHLDDDKRERLIFANLRASTDLSDAAYAAYQKTLFSR
jgi:hypothetical protein